MPLSSHSRVFVEQHCQRCTDGTHAGVLAGSRSHQLPRDMIVRSPNARSLAGQFAKVLSRFPYDMIGDPWQMIDGDRERSVGRWRRRLPLLTCVRWLLAKPDEGFSCRQKGEGRSRIEGSSNHQWGGARGGAKSNLKTRPSRCMIIGCNTPRNAPSLSLCPVPSLVFPPRSPATFFLPFAPLFFSHSIG